MKRDNDSHSLHVSPSQTREIFCAVKNSDIRLIKSMLDGGLLNVDSYLNFGSVSCTALMLAIQEGHLEMVELFIASGANFRMLGFLSSNSNSKHKDNKGLSPLDYSCFIIEKKEKAEKERKENAEKIYEMLKYSISHDCTNKVEVTDKQIEGQNGIWNKLRKYLTETLFQEEVSTEGIVDNAMAIVYKERFFGKVKFWWTSTIEYMVYMDPENIKEAKEFWQPVFNNQDVEIVGKGEAFFNCMGSESYHNIVY